MLLLSATNTAHQVKSSLGLLTSIATCCGQTAKDLIVKLDFEHKNWESVVKRQSKEVRKSLVQFLLSFFIVNHPGVAKEFIEKKSLLVNILPGLIKDEHDIVLLVLTSFKESILENPSIGKTSKMKIFSVANLKFILGLFDWKSQDNSENLKQSVTEATLEFLVTALTSTKNGIVFHDPSYGTSGSNQNHLLFNFLLSLNEPWTKPHLAKLVISSLATCPDQIRPYFAKVLQSLWTPRHSEAWFMLIDFIYAILETIDMPKIVQDLREKPKLMTTVVSQFCCNEKVFKEIVLECVNSNDHLVLVKGLELEALLLNKLNYVLQNTSKIQGNISFQVF